MRKLHIAIAVIVQAEQYLLQLRDGEAAIGGAGLIGCFGGKIEVGETARQAICRELSEETTLDDVESSSLKEAGSFTVVSDHKLEPVRVKAEAFRLNIEVNAPMQAKEGKLLRMSLGDILKSPELLTPATRVYFVQLEQGE